MQRNGNSWFEGHNKLAKIALVAPLIFFIVTYAVIAIGTSNSRPLEVVMSPSMAPDYEVGDLIIVRKIDPADLQIGDIIIYEIEYDSFKERILHMVWNISYIDGEQYFSLYGEMNSRPDVHKGAIDVIHQPSTDSEGRRIIISLVPDKSIQGQVIFKFKYLGWPIAILISFYGLITLILLVTYLYWAFYVRSFRPIRKGLVSLVIAALLITIVIQAFGWSEGHVHERIELIENGFGDVIEHGEMVEYKISGETKQIWGPTYSTDGSILIQVLAKTSHNTTLELAKDVQKWTGSNNEVIYYKEQLIINQLGLVINSNRSDSEYFGFHFPFITSLNDSYIAVDAFAYSSEQISGNVLGQDNLQFVQDMQKWDYSEEYLYASGGYLINYEYNVDAHPYIWPHLFFNGILSVFIGFGYWKIKHPMF